MPNNNDNDKTQEFNTREFESYAQENRANDNLRRTEYHADDPEPITQEIYAVRDPHSPPSASSSASNSSILNDSYYSNENHNSKNSFDRPYQYSEWQGKTYYGANRNRTSETPWYRQRFFWVMLSITMISLGLAGIIIASNSSPRTVSDEPQLTPSPTAATVTVTETAQPVPENSTKDNSNGWGWFQGNSDSTPEPTVAPSPSTSLPNATEGESVPTDAPAFPVPDIKLPEFNTDNIKLPEVKLPSPEEVQSRLEKGWQNTVDGFNNFINQ